MAGDEQEILLLTPHDGVLNPKTNAIRACSFDTRQCRGAVQRSHEATREFVMVLEVPVDLHALLHVRLRCVRAV